MPRSVVVMRRIIGPILHDLFSSFRTRIDLRLEVAALRHQVQVLRRGSRSRVRLTRLDRALWVLLYRLWPRLECLASVDFFVAPTATLRVLFVFIVLQHQRRRIVHFGVAVNPTSQWTSQQIREAFPRDSAPRYLTRDRDASYGAAFRPRLKAMDITEVLSAPRSPWQNAFAERVFGSIRRECLNHVLVLSERHLRRLLSSYLEYCHHSRTHLCLDKDCPEPRPAQPPSPGKIVAFPQVGGLHYRYERLAA
jgi:putative transposase